METDHAPIRRQPSLHLEKNISYVKETAARSREDSCLPHDQRNRKSLLNKPLNFNSKVWENWLGNLRKYTYAKTLTHKLCIPTRILSCLPLIPEVETHDRLVTVIIRIG